MAASTNNYGFPYPQDSDIVDVAGDIQSLAEDIDTKLSEAIADTVGLMVTSNTENGITVTYDDTDNTLDFNVPAFDITFLGDISGTGNILNLGSASAVITVIDDSHNHSSATISDFAEAVADTVGNMVNSNTENGISVTYDDTDNTLDFDVNDFNIVLSGDVSGSAIVTNLASINISASVTDNSHNHTSSNITDFESSVQSVTDSFTTVNVPSGTDPLATLYNDTLTITENNGILITGTGSNTLNVSTNATFNNTASALVSRDSNRTFDITAIDFDTSASAAPQVGRLHWSDGEGTLSTLLKNGNIELAIGQEEVALCYNGSGSPMTKGQVVYISGAQGQKPSILLASSSSETSSSKTFGVVAEPIANGEEGFVTTFGVLKDVNTSSYSEGAALWLSTVTGEITTTMPTQPNHAVFIGYCVRQHASSGQIFIKIQNGYEIQELHNVLITSASAGDVLIYNSASALWINENFNERAQDAISTMISNGTQNNITVSYNDGNNSLSFNVADSATTNVQGTANEIEVTSASNIFTVGLPNNVTIANDLTVSGNMTVSGSTTYLNTTELLVEDNLITLNSGEVGSPSLNAGIEIERGTSANTSIRWNESTDVWEFTNDGTTFYTIKDFDTALATKTTDNLTQGSTNLYFTDEKAQDAIATAIAAGTQTNITVSYNDSTNSFSFVSVDPGVTSLAGTADEVIVSASAGAVTLSLPTTINANTTGTAAALTTARTIELTGDVTGSVSFDGSASASIVTTVVSGGGGGGVTSLLGTADEVTVSASVGAVTLSLPATISQSKISGLTSDLSAKAPIASPTFTGVPAAPTATAGTSTTQIATTEFVSAAVSAGGGGSSATIHSMFIIGGV